MSTVIFSKSGVTSVVFSSARTYPIGDVFIMNQFIGVPDSNEDIRVASLGPARQIIPIIFDQLTNTDRSNLLAFFTNPLVNWALNSFTITDENGASFIVKFLEPEFQMPELSDDNVSLTLNLTVL